MRGRGEGQQDKLQACTAPTHLGPHPVPTSLAPRSLSALAQLVALRPILPFFRGFCQPGGALDQPQLLRGVSRAYAALHRVLLGTAVPTWHSCERGGGGCAEPGVAAAAVECQTLLTWLLLSLGLALPLLAEAASAARLFRHHERQRAAEGLPQEGGPCAEFYRGVGWLLFDEEGGGGGGAGGREEEEEGGGGYSASSMLHTSAAAYLLLAVAWDASVWLSHRAAPGPVP